MTCKNCIHYNICSLWTTSDLDEDRAYEYCFGHFDSASDMVEVVKCKDCKYLEIDKGWQGGRACLMRGGDTGWCHDNDFCSYGERKTIKKRIL